VNAVHPIEPHAAPTTTTEVPVPDRTAPPRRSILFLGALVVVVLAAACSSSSDIAAPDGTTPGSAAPGGGVVRLVTHDSFNVSDSVLAEFTAETGIQVEVLRGGDAVAMVNKAILTKDNPEGDVLFGVDNNTLARALAEGLFAPGSTAGLDRVPDDLELDPEGRVVPVDYGDVCLNYDVEYFANAGVAPPQELSDLTEPQYRDLLVVEDPAKSTPGFAFLLATIATFGEADGAWQAYWSALRENGVQVVDGWEQAYVGAFSGGSGEGDRPIVVSYASSPPYEVANAETAVTEAPTKVVDSSCFRQIELAGVLTNAANPAGAQKLVDFLLTDTFQADIPEQMYVYPVVEGTPLPEAFTKYSSVPTDSLTMPAAEIGANRDAWVEAWTTTVLR
jgi:thiamine transport system substrate-binding protein